MRPQSSSFQRLKVVCSISPPFFLMPFHRALLQSHRPPRQNVIIVSFDAPQPKYAVLFFQTLSIRLNVARASCLYLLEMYFRDPTHSWAVWCSPRRTGLVWSPCLNFYRAGNGMRDAANLGEKMNIIHHLNDGFFFIYTGWIFSWKHIWSLEHNFIPVAKWQSKFQTLRWE